MATTVDTILVRIEADMADVKRSLSSLDKDIKRATVGGAAAFNKFGAAVKAIAGAVIVQQLGRAGAAAVMVAADIQEMQSKSAVVFGAFRQDAVDALTKFGAEVGRSRFELEGMASTLQDTFVPLGFARGEAAKLSVEMTKLAVDVASFNNASDTETLAAFQSALVGNHETVRRFGIIITEATLNQELMAMGIEKGTKAATEQEKVIARMNLIMNGVTDAQGDAARTADSFANQLKEAQSNVTELSAAIGFALMPAATSLLTTFNELTTSILNAGISMGIFAAEPKKKLELVNKEIKELTTAFEIMEVMRGRTNTDGSQAAAAGLIFDYGGVKEAAQALEDLRDERDALQNTIDEMSAVADAAKAAAKEIEGTGDAASDTSTKLNDYDQTLKDIELELKRVKLEQIGFKDAQIKSIESAGLLDTALGVNLQTMDGMTKELRHLLQKTNEVTIAQDFLTKAEEKAEAKKKALADAAKEYANNLTKLKDLVQDTIAPTTTLEEQIAGLELHLSSSGPKIDGAREALEKLKDELYMQNPAIQIFQNGIESMADTLSDYLVNAVADGKANLKDLRKAFNQTLKQMVADAIAAEIIKPFIGDIFKTAGRNTGGKLGDFISSIGGKATGGPVNRNQPYVVGERGPELFVPQAAGSVINAASTRSMSGGGVVVNQTFNVSTGVQQTVRNEIRSLMPQIADGAKAAVADAKRRGGSYGRAFA